MYSGNASYNAFGDHNGEKFTTSDRDNDRWSSVNCAEARGGGFWYRSCGPCLVNAARSTGYFNWYGLPGADYLQSTRMWLQCK